MSDSGIPTWDFGELQEDWEAIWDQLDTLNLDGKIVACTAWAISWLRRVVPRRARNAAR
jgi:hypothetical protein